MEKQLLFIMNPVAGQKKASRVLCDILLVFCQAGYRVTTVMTTGPGTATKAAETLGKDADLVVCCGGDGTMNETVAGLMKAGISVPLGYIPAGTTNDFATGLKLSLNPVQAARDIVEGVPKVLDVGLFNDRLFCYVASFGAFTRASYQIPQDIKNLLGHTAYVLGGISELSQIRNEHLQVELDGQEIEDDFVFGAICNSTSIGGILALDPRQVDMCDGLFEIMLVRQPRNLEEIAECIQALQSQKYDCAMITFRSVRDVKIRASADMPWTLDGERADGQEQIHIGILHAAITLMVRKDEE